jgi:serine/threonine protein kinase
MVDRYRRLSLFFSVFPFDFKPNFTNLSQNSRGLQLHLTDSSLRPMEIAPGTQIEGYTFLERIGGGAFSVVYRVKSVRFGSEYAAKVLLPDTDSSTRNQSSYHVELTALKTLSHPNIILLFSTFTHEGCNVLVFEFCPRGNLRDEAKANEERGISMERFVSIAWQMLDALHYCHSQNICHCDIKPQNILIDEHGRPKLADFGIARHRDADLDGAMGTLSYTAPELFQDGPRNRQASDIWALGVTFAYLLDAHIPWPPDPVERRQAILSGRFVIQRSIPPSLRHMLHKMLAVDPSLRWTAERLKQHDFMNEFSRGDGERLQLENHVRRTSLPLVLIVSERIRAGRVRYSLSNADGF